MFLKLCRADFKLGPQIFFKRRIFFFNGVQRTFNALPPYACGDFRHLLRPALRGSPARSSIPRNWSRPVVRQALVNR